MLLILLHYSVNEVVQEFQLSKHEPPVIAAGLKADIARYVRERSEAEAHPFDRLTELCFPRHKFMRLCRKDIGVLWTHSGHSGYRQLRQLLLVHYSLAVSTATVIFSNPPQ